MKQKRPAYLHQDKLSSRERNLNNDVHNVFWIVTLIASYAPEKISVYLSFHRAQSVAQQKGVHLTPARFYRAVDKLAEENIIHRTEFKYRYRLNPEHFSFL
ncbi:hypothetical protein [Enterobacter roggenkampii]|uniref:hypothetical protein n=1 Tax=Enterobacter roggenkampii TaxID=1812935 RepID=UPI002DBA9F28|nr:hypothetical protein [Enterobacter roggenkampii]MEB5890303.1 hypothetical protein [Enterobacter roggenkampii]